MTEKVLGYLPERIRRAVMKYARIDDVCEIRLRAFLPVSLTMSFGNVFIDGAGNACPIGRALISSHDDVIRCVNSLCEGSIYRHIKTIREGYIITDDGIRAGVCMSAPADASGDISPDSFGSVNIRIAREVRGASDGLVRFFMTHVLASTLIYSPPGCGKTTMIRDFAVRLSRGGVTHEGGRRMPRRVCVIDQKSEIFPPMSGFESGGGTLDIVRSFSKSSGIDSAVRTLGPEVIICDEIGADDSGEAILSASSGGIVFIATAHGSSAYDVMRKPEIAYLCSHGVFSYIARIEKNGGFPFSSSVTVEEISGI